MPPKSLQRILDQLAKNDCLALIARGTRGVSMFLESIQSDLCSLHIEVTDLTLISPRLWHGPASFKVFLIYVVTLTPATRMQRLPGSARCRTCGWRRRNACTYILSVVPGNPGEKVADATRRHTMNPNRSLLHQLRRCTLSDAFVLVQLRTQAYTHTYGGTNPGATAGSFDRWKPAAEDGEHRRGLEKEAAGLWEAVEQGKSRDEGGGFENQLRATPPDMGVVKTASESILEDAVVPSEEANYSVQGHTDASRRLLEEPTRLGNVYLLRPE
ncbi:hypothetical protein WN48_10093 [Eufriesea mexicana]|nr:hypothetical protein WN48_10093 [Eufriesea mexicana]